jgi:hypothetical protein
MRVCGVELLGNQAIICIMQLKEGLFDVPKVRIAKLDLAHAVDTSQLVKFQFDFSQLMKDYQVDRVIIKQRDLKGKFAGDTLSFKIEAALQLMTDFRVEVISPSFIKQGIAKSQVRIDVRDVGLKKFQEPALLTAFGYLEHQAALARE